MRISIVLIIIGILTAFTFHNQLSEKEYPTDYFDSPVEHPLYLSGTFGELRPNHFHSGIDIKAYRGKVGEPILAAADGYIKRIKIQSGSYGNVLYIAHPNGYLTVYAHLQKFTKPVAEYIQKIQYEQKVFELDIAPDIMQFPVSQGQKIGQLGTSGRSFGPHLHFEIRDLKTEKPINPLLFGFAVKDNIRPKLHQLKVYHLNDKGETLQTEKHNLRKQSGQYGIKGDTLVIDAWRVGLGLKAYDHQNGASNWNGIYSLEMLVDDSLMYSFKMESFAFDETRYINAHLDYEEQVTNKSYYNRVYRLPGNQLSIYKSIQNDGFIKLFKNKAQKVEMIVRDIENNKSKLSFWVKRGSPKVPLKKEMTYKYLLPFNEGNIIQNSNLYLFFPKGALYENLYLQYHSVVDSSTDVFSMVHHIHQYTTPVHAYYDIGIKPKGLPDSLRNKAFIAYCDHENKIINYGGEWKMDKLQAKTRLLGDYCIKIDVIAPSIKAKIFKSDLRGYNKISFKVRDNFKMAKHLNPFTYEASIDGKWILMIYDAKKDLLTHRFETDLPKGKHTFLLKVTDIQGNSSIFEKEFSR